MDDIAPTSILGFLKNFSTCIGEISPFEELEKCMLFINTCLYFALEEVSSEKRAQSEISVWITYIFIALLYSFMITCILSCGR